MIKIDYLLLANLMAGSGMTGKILDRVESFLTSKGLTSQSIEIHEPQRISKIEWGESNIVKKAVVCIGGDGTVTETIGFIKNNHINVPLAIIPAGTANILYNTLNLWTVGYDFLIQNRVKAISIGTAEFEKELEYFTIGVGVGFSEKYIELTDKGLKKSLGSIAYIVVAIKELLTVQPIPVTMITNKESKSRKIVLLLAFNIHPKILKIFPLYPFKKVNDDDGKINVFYLRYRNKLQAIVGTLACHILGRYNFHLIKKIKADEITLSSPVNCPTQIDGELRGELPVKLSICKEKIRLLV